MYSGDSWDGEEMIRRYWEDIIDKTSNNWLEVEAEG